MNQAFNEPVRSVILDLVPLIRQLFAGPFAIAVAGSVGKKKDDSFSDIDLRAYYDAWIADESLLGELKQKINDKIAGWAGKGVLIDGYWPRRIEAIDTRLRSILSGANIDPDPCIWTIGGYYLPTDIMNNTIIEDPYRILANWQGQLRAYPDAYKQAVIKKYLASAEYWQNDYHYQSKVQRKDIVFCSGIANLLVHDLIQIIFALNNAYYSGDGWNLNYVRSFAAVPAGFASEIEKVLLIGDANDFAWQRDTLCRLIDQVKQLVLKQASQQGQPE